MAISTQFKKNVRLSLSSYFIFIFINVLLINGCSKKEQEQNTEAVLISASKVKSIPYSEYIETIGQIQSMQQATLSMDAIGVIKAIHFDSGQSVKKGDLLIELNHDLNIAELAGLESDYKVAKHMLKRKRRLAHNISPAELEESEAKQLQAQTALDLLKVKIKQKKLFAPFDGKLGLKEIEIGEFVSQGKPLIKLVSLDKLQVIFSVPEQYLAILSIRQKINFQTDLFPKKIFSAHIQAFDNQSEANSHLIHIEAMIDPKQTPKLYPGLFVKLKLYDQSTSTVLTIPQTAVNFNLYGNSVFEIECLDNTCRAKEQFVKLGKRIGGDIIVKSGLKENASVITSGQLKVHHNSLVLIDKENLISEEHKP